MKINWIWSIAIVLVAGLSYLTGVDQGTETASVEWRQALAEISAMCEENMQELHDEWASLADELMANYETLADSAAWYSDELLICLEE